MNVFILCTGRCGSATFIKACEYIENYSSGHESRVGLLGNDRMAFPTNHIEADNRLSWHLGRLDKSYSDDAFYVHLKRDPIATAKSFRERYEYSGAIMPAYEKGLLMNRCEDSGSLQVCLDYCETVNTNIHAFLKDKTKKMDFRLENCLDDFSEFWRRIGARGDLEVALAEWKKKHNQSLVQTAAPRRSVILNLRRTTKNTFSKILNLR